MIYIFPQRNFLWISWANWNTNCNFFLSYHNGRVTTWAWITRARTKSLCWSLLHIDEALKVISFQHMLHTFWKTNHSMTLVFPADKESQFSVFILQPCCQAHASTLLVQAALRICCLRIGPTCWHSTVLVVHHSFGLLLYRPPPLWKSAYSRKHCFVNAGTTNTCWYHIRASLRGVIKVYSQSVCVYSTLTCQFQAVFRLSDSKIWNSSWLLGVMPALTFPL